MTEFIDAVWLGFALFLAIRAVIAFIEQP